MKISSTKIRNALKIGDAKEAKKYLGDFFQLKGKVVLGDQIGTKIDFPTANVQVSEDYKLIPCQGVYAVRVIIGKKEYSAMCNIGVRPTINDFGEKRIEVNIFDFKGDLYGQELCLKFIQKVRDEKTFANLEELKQQLARVKSAFAQRVSWWNTKFEIPKPKIKLSLIA